MKSTWVLVLGLILGLVSGFLVYQRLNQDDEVVPLASQTYLRLRPSVTLSKGDIIDWDDLEKVSVPADFEPLSSVAVKHSDELQTWINSNQVRANRDLGAGSFLMTESLIDKPTSRFSANISPKGRAIAIPVSEVSSVGYFVEPGSRVDILVTVPRYSEPSSAITTPAAFGSTANLSVEEILANTQTGAEAVITKTLLQNMRVLAVGSSTTRNAYINGGRDGYGTVTLDASLEEAELLTFASSQARGGMQLVLRNPTNVEVETVDVVDWNSVSD